MEIFLGESSFPPWDNPRRVRNKYFGLFWKVGVFFLKLIFKAIMFKCYDYKLHISNVEGLQRVLLGRGWFQQIESRRNSFSFLFILSCQSLFGCSQSVQSMLGGTYLPGIVEGTWGAGGGAKSSVKVIGKANRKEHTREVHKSRPFNLLHRESG